MSDPVLAEAAGVIDGANRAFTSPSAYVAGTLWVYLNGLLVEQDGVEGPVELGGNRFELREAPRTGDTVHVYYQEHGPTPSPFPTPPRAYATLNLIPIPATAFDLVPLPDDAEPPAETASPDPLRAFDMKPEGVAAIDLVPVPLSAEEV